MRNKEESNYKSLADFLKNHFRRKIYKKKGFETERLEFMRQQLNEVNGKISELEKKKNF